MSTSVRMRFTFALALAARAAWSLRVYDERLVSALIAAALAPQPAHEPHVPAPDDDVAPVQWRARARVILPVDHYAYRAAVRARPMAANTCAPFELALVTGFDHVPQYVQRFFFAEESLDPNRPDCRVQSLAQRYSARALHFSDIAAANLFGDAAEELVVTSFADREGSMADGGVYLVPGGDDLWEADPPRLLGGGADPMSPSSVAVGDASGDGLLDIVVGVFRRQALAGVSSRIGGASITRVVERDLEAGATLLLAREPSRDTSAAPRFAAPLRVGSSRGAMDVHLADVDRDGALDVVSAGLELTIALGGRDAALHLWPEDAAKRVGLLHSVDVTHYREAGRVWALVAATESCLNAATCAKKQEMCVLVWRLPTGAVDLADLRAAAPERFAVHGIPSPVRFLHLDGDAQPDVVVGLMTTPKTPAAMAAPSPDGDRRPEYGALGYVGAAPLVMTSNERSGGHLFGPWRALVIEDEQGSGQRLPMASSITVSRSLVNPSDERAVLVVSEEVPLLRVLTWVTPERGTRGRVIGVASVTDAAGHARAFAYVPGDQHVVVQGAVPGPGDSPVSVTVRWQLTEHPSVVITSASLLDGPSGGTLVLGDITRVE